MIFISDDIIDMGEAAMALSDLPEPPIYNDHDHEWPTEEEASENPAN